MKDSILEYVKSQAGTSFSRLVGEVGGTGGDVIFLYAGYSNLVLWPALSRGAVNALISLFREGKLEIVPAPEIASAAHCATIDLPVAMRVKSYRNLRWLPVMLHVPPRACGICGKTGVNLHLRKSWVEARGFGSAPQNAWACASCDRKEQRLLKAGSFTLADLWDGANSPADKQPQFDPRDLFAQ